MINRITRHREANIDRMRRRIAVRRDVQEWSAFWLVSRDSLSPSDGEQRGAADPAIVVVHRDVLGEVEHVTDGSPCPCMPVRFDATEPGTAEDLLAAARDRQEGEA